MAARIFVRDRIVERRRADGVAASGQATALSSTRASSRSDGRLRCTGPGRPEVAMRIASPMSRPSVAVALAVHDALVTGAAMSAWRISWKPPRPSSQVAAWPDSSTIGDSAPSAVNSAPTALAWPGPPVTSAMPGFAGEAAVRVGHVHGGRLVAHVDEIEAGIERGVEDRHDVIAGQREHAPAAEALQRSGDDVGAAQRLAHVGHSPLAQSTVDARRRASLLPLHPHRSLIPDAYRRAERNRAGSRFSSQFRRLAKGDPYE